MEANVITIVRRNFPCFVTPMLVKDLDKTKCSPKFLSHNFPEDMVVYVKCYPDGELDMRGNKGEYRIIPNKEVPQE